MIDWLKYLSNAITQQEPCVLVTVAGTRGSTPREIGAKMVVTKSQTFGTIGGGQLEYQCTQVACSWLGGDFGKSRSRLKRFPLGTNCGQCCGGVADVLFEEIGPAQSEWIRALITCHAEGQNAVMLTIKQSRDQVGKLILTANECFGHCDELTSNTTILFSARAALDDSEGARQASVTLDSLSHLTESALSVLIEPVGVNIFHIAVFGAGHVGSACVDIFSKLDAQVHLIDSRDAMLDVRYPDNVQVTHAHEPTSLIPYLPACSYCLVMTHDHALDLELCVALLRRNDLAFCGLIGSRSKRRRFKKRFQALGLSKVEISRLTCPIGIEEIRGKKPYEIAIAVMAQLLKLREAGMSSELTARRLWPREASEQARPERVGEQY